MQTIIVNFTAQEAQALVQLIDIAVKAGGMQVAEAAVILTRKVGEAAQAAQQVSQLDPRNSQCEGQAEDDAA